MLLNLISVNSKMVPNLLPTHWIKYIKQELNTTTTTTK